MKINKFDNIIFDCDGVILNSNQIKTKAFAESVRHYGDSCIDAFVNYHLKNGGVSRYKKFDFFIEEVLPRYRPDLILSDKSYLHGMLLASYSSYLKYSLLHCEVAPSLDLLRSLTSSSSWFIVSGGDQSELRYLFRMRQLSQFFDGGIYGSPDTKYEIIRTLIDNNQLSPNSLFIGDSLIDYQVSCYFDIAFVFVQQWSEFKDMNSFALDHSIPIIDKLSDLLNY